MRQLIVTINLRHTCCYDGTGPATKCGCLNTARNVVQECVCDDVADKVRTICTDDNGDCHVSYQYEDVTVVHNIVPELYNVYSIC
jgi:hypothetical protein